MARLEYRLKEDPDQLICFYEDIRMEELLIRNAADWFIRSGNVYERQQNEQNPQASIIYVRAIETGEPAPPEKNSGFTVEVREFAEGLAEFPVLQTKRFGNLLEVLLFLQSDTICLFEKKWSKSSFEVDEDRKVFVYYTKPSE